MVAGRLNSDRPDGVVLGVNIGKNKDTPLDEQGEMMSHGAGKCLRPTGGLPGYQCQLSEYGGFADCRR